MTTKNLNEDCHDFYELFKNISIKKKVHFDPILNIVEEPSELAEFLRQSRISDWVQRQADKMRMERLLNPILLPSHRLKKYNELCARECFTK